MKAQYMCRLVLPGVRSGWGFEEEIVHCARPGGGGGVTD